jgi:hypothetical protein
MPAPIALIAYRRPDHLARVLSALRSNPECRDTALYVFSDGPRAESEKVAVERVREIISNVEGFASLNVTFRPENWGLSRNIIDAASYVLDRHGEVIVVEDDVFVAPFFLQFMNNGLARYREKHRVSCISGYCYPIKSGVSDTFFLRGGECWGWATWSDRWATFNPDSSELLAELRSSGLREAFDLDGAFGFTRMLEDNIAGRINTWCICWHASCFLRSMLTLYPARSLVQNIGFDGFASTHSPKGTLYDVDLATAAVPVEDIEIEENPVARDALKRYFRRVASQSNPSSARRIFRRIARILPPTIFRRLTELHRQGVNYG